MVGAARGTGWRPGGAAGGQEGGPGWAGRPCMGTRGEGALGPISPCPRALSHRQGPDPAPWMNWRLKATPTVTPSQRVPLPCTSAPRCGSWSSDPPFGVIPQKRGLSLAVRRPQRVTRLEEADDDMSVCGAFGSVQQGREEGFSCRNQERDSPSDPVFRVQGPGAAWAGQCWSRRHTHHPGRPPGHDRRARVRMMGSGSPRLATGGLGALGPRGPEGLRSASPLQSAHGSEASRCDLRAILGAAGPLEGGHPVPSCFFHTLKSQ